MSICDEDAAFCNLVLGSVFRGMEEQFCGGLLRAETQAIYPNVCSMTGWPYSLKPFLGADGRVMENDADAMCEDTEHYAVGVMSG